VGPCTRGAMSFSSWIPILLHVVTFVSNVTEVRYALNKSSLFKGKRFS
jgi:hypothetical protein